MIDITGFMNNLLWTEGLYIALATSALFFVGLIWFKPLAYLALFFFIFCVYFFRNPHRTCPEALTDDSVLICPSDGKVVDIQSYDPELPEGFAQKVSIFLSPIDVHVTWSPIAGTVEKVLYKPGTFAMAFLPKSSELNERNDIHIVGKNGKTIRVRQIAGTIARRICCWVAQGDAITHGQKIGMIRFGSRVDIFVPRGVELNVKNGDRVYGGQTVLGRWLCD